VSQAIDRSIEFSQAMRPDLAKITLVDLLQKPLSPIEKAAVLYNLSTLYAQEANFWEALLSLAQIDEGTYREVKIVSPLLAAQIAYNGAISSMRYVSGEISKVVAGQLLLQQEMIDSFQNALYSATEYIEQFSESIQADSTLIRRRLLEELSQTQLAFATVRDIFALEQMAKSQFLDRFSELLYTKRQWVMKLVTAERESSQESKLYLDYFNTDAMPTLSLYLERLLLYLQAPAKESEQMRHEYLQKVLRTLYQEMKQAIIDDEPLELLVSLQELLHFVLIVQGKALNRDIQVILDNRLEVAAYYSLTEKTSPLLLFWQDVWQDELGLYQRFLDVIVDDTQDQSKKALLQALNRRLDRAGTEPSVIVALDDISYWKILSADEKETFLEQALLLHGAKNIARNSLEKTLQALSDRLEAMGMPKAREALLLMKHEESPILLFQDLMQSWYLADPSGAISYLIDTLQEELPALLVPNPAASLQFVARTDFQLLYHLLENETAKSIKDVRQDLAKRISWFSDPKRAQLDYYKLSLDLSWLKEKLVKRQGTIESITHNVDFGVDFQKKTMGLVRFSGEIGITQLLEEISWMQYELANTVASDLARLPKRGPKIKQVQEIMEQVKRGVIGQVRELSIMQQVLGLLEKASQILHSLQSESLSEQSGELTQNEDLSMQMQNKALRLTPENSIRLLQEMAKQDRGLEVKVESQVTGPKPW